MSWKNPINKAAIADGRASPPPPPDAIHLELTTAAINKFLNTHYTPDEIENMPASWLDKMMLIINAHG